MTTTELIEAVRDYYHGPTSQNLGDDTARILRFATREMEENLVPEVTKVMEDYFTVEEQLDFGTSKTKAPIPRRAYNTQLTLIQQEFESGDRSPYPLQYINRRDRARYATSGRPVAAYLEGDSVRFNTTPGSNAFVSYPFSPSDLVETSRAAQVASVSGQVIGLSQSVPAFGAAGIFDCLARDHSHQPKFWGKRGTVSGTNITFTDDISTEEDWKLDVEVGDWIALEGESPVVMLPQGFQGLLAIATCRRLAEVQGDMDLYDMVTQRYAETLKKQREDLDQRVEEPIAPINFNSRFRRSGQFWYGNARRGWF